MGLQADLAPSGSKSMGLNLTTERKALSIGKDWTLSTTMNSANGDADFGKAFIIYRFIDLLPMYSPSHEFYLVWQS